MLKYQTIHTDPSKNDHERPTPPSLGVPCSGSVSLLLLCSLFNRKNSPRLRLKLLPFGLSIAVVAIPGLCGSLLSGELSDAEGSSPPVDRWLRVCRSALNPGLRLPVGDERSTPRRRESATIALKGLDKGLMSGPGIILATDARVIVDGRSVFLGESGCRRVASGVSGSLIWASVGRRGFEKAVSRGRGREICSWDDCQGFWRRADGDGEIEWSRRGRLDEMEDVRRGV